MANTLLRFSIFRHIAHPFYALHTWPYLSGNEGRLFFSPSSFSAAQFSPAVWRIGGGERNLIWSERISSLSQMEKLCVPDSQTSKRSSKENFSQVRSSSTLCQVWVLSQKGLKTLPKHPTLGARSCWWTHQLGCAKHTHTHTHAHTA